MHFYWLSYFVSFLPSLPFLPAPATIIFMDAFFVQWHITDLCNLRCRHCYQDDFSPKRDLDYNGLKKIAENLLASIGGWDRKACLHLTGGEPLLKPELFPLLGDLDRDPVVEEMGIITNGVLLDPPMVERLSAYPKLKKIKISLEGPDANTNDSIRPVGTFHRVEKGVSAVNNGRFEVILMITVMKRNYQCLPSYLRLAKDWGVRSVIIERFIPLGKGREIQDEVLSREQWQHLVNSLYAFLDLEMEEKGIFPYQAFQIEFQGKNMELLGAPCVLGTEGLCVMPEGTVFPCRRFPHPIGNLMEDSLKIIWEKSEVLQKLRKKTNLKGKCGSCPILECTGCRSLAYALTGDFLAEDPHCWFEPSSLLQALSKID